MERPLFRQSLETQALVKLLSDDKHDPTFTYEELGAVVEGDIRDHKRRPSLYSAFRIVQREKAVVFECIANVGYKRASDSDIVSGRARDLSHIRSTARRGLKKIECIRDVAALSKDKKTELNVLASGLGLVAHVTTAQARGLIEQKVVKSQQRLPVAETIEALSTK